MKIFKFSSVLLLSFLFMWVCMPQLSAKHHKHRHHRSTSFSLNFNVAQPRVYEPIPVYRPAYVERTAPAYVERTAVVRPYQPIVEERVYYPAYREVIVERPYAERVYVHPQFSYYSSWGWGY